MKSRCVLIVNERQAETAVIRKILMGENAHTTVFAVQSGRQALDVLMGGKCDILVDGILPDAVIVSDSITDMSSEEIRNITAKYYRLRNIKFYLLTEIGDKNNLMLPENFSGYFQRPIADDKITRKKFLPLKLDLGKDVA